MTPTRDPAQEQRIGRLPYGCGDRLCPDRRRLEAGADATVIMTKGHWRSIRTDARYTKPGLAAITTTELLDPPHRQD